VDDCVGYPIPAEGRLEADYTEPERAENPFAGLKRGDRVLALVRPSFGLATIPNGDGEDFAIMPGGKAAIYRMAKAGDPTAEETMRIGRAIAIPGLRERLDAISSIIGNGPSPRMKEFLQAYLENVVRQAEADLTWAKALSGQVKSSRTRPAEKGAKSVGFPVLPPIPDADPSVRDKKAFSLPTDSGLRIKRTDDQISVGVDPGRLKSVELGVGKNMVVGFKHELFVYREDKLIESHPGGMQSPPDGVSYSTLAYSFKRGTDKIPQPGETYRVEVRLSLFETDIPTQHFWQPESGKYRVLWTKTLKQEVK
jgi:hypothetical protein